MMKLDKTDPWFYQLSDDAFLLLETIFVGFAEMAAAETGNPVERMFDGCVGLYKKGLLVIDYSSEDGAFRISPCDPSEAPQMNVKPTVN